MDWMLLRLALGLSLPLCVSLACGGADAPGAASTQETTTTTTTEDTSSQSEASESEASEVSTDTSSTTGPEACALVDGALPPQAEGDFIAQDAMISDTRMRCHSALHASAGAAASTVRLTLDEFSASSARVRVENLLGEALVDWTERAPGEFVDVTLAQSGEFFVRLEAEDPDAEDDSYTLSVACQSGCGLEFTRYPTLFMHGMAGTEAFFDVIEYWFQVEDYVRTPGFEVAIRAVDAFASTNARTLQWADHIDALVQAGVGRRFNLLAHSQGGLDARRYTSLIDTDARIVSVTTIATPHQGTSVADLALGVFDAFPVDPVTINGVVEALSGLIGLSGPDLVGQLEDLSTQSMVEFNANTPDVEGVYYSSWSGKSCAATDLLCQAGNEGEIVDPLFSIPYGFMRLAEGDNDGATGVESCKWGDWQGTIPADHMDEIGQIADLTAGAFDHKAFYLSELRRLAARGL